MRYRLLALALILGGCMTSCSEDTPPATTTSAAPLAAPETATPVNLAPGTTAPAGVAGQPVASNEPVAPADAKWTLLCYKYNGLGHVEASRALKESLAKRTRRSDWHILHGLDSSEVYLGYYRAVSEKDSANLGEVARAKSDREMIAGLPDDQGIKYFEHCSFVPLSGPDPTAPPEWNLVNIDRPLKPRDPRRRYWSLQILAFKDDALRKQAAVQAVEGLRQNGIEAYYYHGENVSSVCVGAWPRLAVKEQADDGTHRVGGPNTTLLVSAEPIPEQLKPKRFDDQGKPIIAVAPKLEVVDKTMEAAIKAFPEHWVNYEVRVNRTQDNRTIVDPSFLVVIPRARGDGYYDSDEPAEPIAGSREDRNVGFSPEREPSPIRRDAAGDSNNGAILPENDRPGRPGGL